MVIDLCNKHALVCGSTQGIGKAIAFELASSNAKVTLFARNKESLKKALNEINQVSDGNDYLVADFEKPEEVKSVIEHQLRRKSYDILINNTGGPSAGAITEATTDDFQKGLNAHLMCNHILARHLIPHMKEAGYGRIINVVSTSVKIPIPGLGVSNTVRGAIANWSKTLSLELAQYGITVNNILPGLTNTKRLETLFQRMAEDSGKTTSWLEEKMKESVPAKRFGEPSEIAYLAAFLASPYANYINGTNIPVDGGRTGSL
ncbi:MAG TPA: SDR family oxidoreductase [Cyclobacteriaceae bacterium]